MAEIPISLAIKRSEIDNISTLVELLDLAGLKLIDIEPRYYIIAGDGSSMQAFLSFAMQQSSQLWFTVYYKKEK